MLSALAYYIGLYKFFKSSNLDMSENDTDPSVERMRDHLGLITTRYRDICFDMAALEEDVHDALDLDRLFRTDDFEGTETETTFSYFGLQLKNVSFALNSLAATLERRAESLKNSSPFQIEESMHTGKGISNYPCQEITTSRIARA